MGVVGASGDLIAWDIVAANYVRGSYGRYALRCEIVQSTNSMAIIGERPVWSPYPCGAAGCVKLPLTTSDRGNPRASRDSGYYGETIMMQLQPMMV